MADGITRTSDVWHDTFAGTVAAMLAAGIIDPRHLEPQPWRSKGCTAFMSDGRVAEHGMNVAMVFGALRVRVYKGGSCTAIRTVSNEEHLRRLDERGAQIDVGSDELSKGYRGTAEHLRRANVPPEWFADLPSPGKQKGCRVLYDGEWRIEVHVGSRREFRIETTHIDYYTSYLDEEFYQKKREEFGLAPARPRAPVHREAPGAEPAPVRPPSRLDAYLAAPMRPTIPKGWAVIAGGAVSP